MAFWLLTILFLLARVFVEVCGMTFNVLFMLIVLGNFGHFDEFYTFVIGMFYMPYAILTKHILCEFTSKLIRLMVSKPNWTAQNRSHYPITIDRISMQRISSLYNVLFTSWHRIWALSYNNCLYILVRVGKSNAMYPESEICGRELCPRRMTFLAMLGSHKWNQWFRFTWIFISTIDLLSSSLRNNFSGYLAFSITFNLTAT